MNGFKILEDQKMDQEKMWVVVAHSLLCTASYAPPCSDIPATVYRAVMANSPTMAR